MRIWIPITFIIVLSFAALILLSLHPPKTLTLATGPSGGAYHQVAERYRTVLARDGINVKLVETSGSVDNAGLISDGGVDAAILQGGIKVANSEIEAIGTVFFEPMLFVANLNGTWPDNPALWKELRFNVGSPGSGTAAAFRDFEAAVGLSPEVNQHFEFSYDESIAALTEGAVDIAVFVAPVDAPYLVSAYDNPSIHLVPMTYVEAISRRLNNAKTVTVPIGAVSLLPVIPATPRLLIALEARLAITPDLHPALVNRLTMAAIEIHKGRGVIRDYGTFPSVEGTGMPVNTAARQLILNGPSIWHDWLPYWMASQVHRLVLLMLPILFIALPTMRAIPRIYTYFMRWRVWKYYPEIRRIEEQLAKDSELSDLDSMDSRLVALDNRLSQIRLPAAYRQTAYDARLHVELVRKRIDEMRVGPQQARSSMGAMSIEVGTNTHGV